MSRYPILLLLMMVLLAVSALAQNAQMVGEVKDPTGAVVPGANVKVTNEATGVSRSVLTNEVGFYSVAPLSQGIYSVQASIAGFKTNIKQGIVLQVNQTGRTDFLLEVGQVSDVTTVTGESPLVASETATVGTVIDNTKILELPMNGRNFLDLARTVNGVIQSTGVAGGIFLNGAGSQSATLMQIDGIDNFEFAFGRPAISPSLDMISEFSIETGRYTAEAGRSSVGQINVVSKYGSNQLHGGLFEFNRNAAVTALNFFDLPRAVRKAQGLPEVPAFNRNQFGASLGGPIFKNKTFFFGNYEGTLIRSTTRGVLTVPDAALRTGDFSARTPIIYDPNTFDPATKKRQAFSGNKIPSTRISPIALNVLKYVPAPNTSGFVANYVSNIATPDDTHQFTGRVDHNFSQNDTFNTRYTYKRQTSLLPGFIGTVLFPDFSETGQYNAHNLSINEVHTFNPRTLNQFTVGYSRWSQNRHFPNTGTNVSKALGLDPGLPESDLEKGWPTFGVSGFSMPVQTVYSPAVQAVDSFQGSDKFSHEFTTHSLKAGFEILYRRSPIDFQYSRGSYSFGPVFTTSGQLASGTSENAFADFLLGLPSSVGRQFGHVNNTSDDKTYSLYVQDDWRIHPNLTLNLGLRYENWTGVYERFDRFATFDFTTLSFVQVGKNGIPRSGWNRDNNNLAPRFGFAWRMFGNNKTVLRGGYGINYDYRISNTFFNMNAAPPWVFGESRSNTNDVPTLTLSNPFPGSSPSAPPQVGGTAIRRDLVTPYVQQWSFNLQREIFQNTVFDIGYVANRGVKNLLGWDINYSTPGLAAPALRRRWPQLGSVAWTDNPGRSWYDSMQMRVERRYKDGFTITGSYTWAKSLGFGCLPGTQNECSGFRNPFDMGADKGPEQTDFRHRLVVSSIYELPIGRGKKFMASIPRALDMFIGGWQGSVIATFQSGPPVTPGLTFDNSSVGGSRPDVNGDPMANAPRTIEQWFDPSVFSLPPTLQSLVNAGKTGIDLYRAQGNAGKGIIRGPGLQLWDIAISKRFHVWEQHNLQFRAEFFNAWNHPNFGTPNASYPVIPNATGRITSTSTANRQIQFGLRYNF